MFKKEAILMLLPAVLIVIAILIAVLIGPFFAHP